MTTKRSLTTIDDDLSIAVKSRASAKAQISTLSKTVVAQTRKIDRLLAERTAIQLPACPDSPASLAVNTTGVPERVIVPPTA